MLFTYDKKSKKISHLPKTTLREHNIFERKDLEKWIEDTPFILNEELLILSTEYDQFDKTNERLDLLAMDKEGNLVIVELKRDDSGKNVELQAIKYAAYCSTLTFDQVIDLYQQYHAKKGKTIDHEKAQQEIIDFVEIDEFKQINEKPRIILVSKEYRPEVTASVLWLRKFGIDISCVKLTPYVLNDSMLGFESTILIPLPEAKDFIIQSEKKDNAKNTLTRNQEEYLEFWEDLVKETKKSVPLSFPQVKPRSYYQIPTGIPNTHLEWTFHGRPRSSLGVEIHFESGDRQKNLHMMEKFEKYKGMIEEKTGEVVTIQKNFGTRWTRLYIEKTESKITQELKIWAVEKMKIFYEIIKSEFDSIVV